MSRLGRREMLMGGVTAAAAAAVRPVQAVTDPIVRKGRPAMKAAIAAYSYRDRLTGKTPPPMDLTGFVRQAAETGWDGVELTSYYFPNPTTDEYLARLKRECFVRGLGVSGSSVGNVFTHPAGAERDKEIAKVAAWLANARALGAPALRIFAGAPQRDQSVEDARKCCIECLEICAEHAAKNGVMLGLENHGGIVADADGVLALVRAVRSDWLGVNLDTGNFRTADPYGDMARCAPYAVTVHFKTEVQVAGAPKQPADAERIVRILAQAGYRGYVTLEYEAAEPVQAAAPKALEALRKAFHSVLA